VAVGRERVAVGGEAEDRAVRVLLDEDGAAQDGAGHARRQDLVVWLGAAKPGEVRGRRWGELGRGLMACMMDRVGPFVYGVGDE